MSCELVSDDQVGEYRLSATGEKAGNGYSTCDSLKSGVTGDEIVSQNLPQGSGASAVPLRLRQLPASFWKEPNRPKTDYYSFPAVSVAYLGQGYKQYQPLYKDLSVGPEIAAGTYCQRSLSSPSLKWAMRGADTMADYFYRNYTTKYQCSKVPDLSGWSLRLPDSGLKFPPRPLTGVSSSPYVLSQQRRVGTDLGYPVPGVGLPTGLWDGLTLGQYPNHPGHETQAPWRPVPSKSTSSYSSRYHPFVV